MVSTIGATRYLASRWRCSAHSRGIQRGEYSAVHSRPYPQHWAEAGTVPCSPLPAAPQVGVGALANAISADWNYEITNGALYRARNSSIAFRLTGYVWNRWQDGLMNTGLRVRILRGQAHCGGVAVMRRAAPGEPWILFSKCPGCRLTTVAIFKSAQAADYGAYRERTIRYWQKLLGETNRMTVSAEPMIEQAHRATAVHTLLATRTIGGQRMQTDGSAVPEEFLPRPGVRPCLDNFGLPGYYLRANLRVLPGRTTARWDVPRRQPGAWQDNSHVPRAGDGVFA